MKLGNCKKGWFIFYFHDWEKKSTLKVIPKGHWTHNLYMSMNGHNIVERDTRFVCSKCGEVHEY